MGGPPPQGSLGSAVQTAELDFNLSAESIPVVTADGDSLEEHSTDLFFDTDASPKELNVSAAVAATDGSGHVGAADARFANLVGNQHQVFGSSGDANPVVQVDSDGVKFGPGGGSGVTTLIQRHTNDDIRIRNADDTGFNGLAANPISATAFSVTFGDSGTFKARDTSDNQVTVATLNRASTPTFDLDQARLTANLALSADASHDIGSTSNGLGNVFLGDDSAVQFGASQDWQIDYDSTNTRARIHDGTNDVLLFEDGSQDITLAGGTVSFPSGKDISADSSTSPTFANLPSGADTANPGGDGWLEVDMNGTTAFIPYWT